MSNFPLPYSSLKRSTKPIRPRKKAQVRVGKVTGKIRLSGQALTALRNAVYMRDKGGCQRCGMWLPKEGSLWIRAHMAHKVSRGAGGSDTPENCHLLCWRDHLVEEHSKGLKG